jgi:uncharacterized protein (TIGR00251 family)
MKRFKIKVITKSSLNSVIPSNTADYDFKVKVSTAPEKGNANKKVLELLSQYFAVSRNSIMIISGEHHNLKTIEINE